MEDVTPTHASFKQYVKEKGDTLKHPKIKSFFYPLVGLAVVSYMCYFSRLQSPRLTPQEGFPCAAIPKSRNYLSGVANTVPLRVLHSNVPRVLIDDRLPLDPKDNQSWSVFQDSLGYQCSEYKIRFGLSMPRVWLASFPRSGNTWTRYLLEAASGVFTGSVYVDEELFAAGFLGEREDPQSQRTLVQKTHLHSVRAVKDDSLYRRFLMNAVFEPTVLLLRNPAQAVLSYYKWLKNRHNASTIPAFEYTSEAFRSYVKDEVERWTELALDRLLWTEAPLYVMHYEHLLENPIKEITALLAFLGVPKDDGRLACLSRELEGKFKSEESEPLDPYTHEEKVMMKAGALAVNRTLMLLGYPPLPTYSDLPM